MLSPRLIVDFHHHLSPELAPTKNLRTVYAYGIPVFTENPLLTDVASHLSMMDAAGIDAAVLTSGAGMLGGLKRAAGANVSLAETCAKYPDRFRFLAHAAPLAGEAGIREVKKWTEESPGVVMTSAFGDTGVDDERLEPLFDLLEDSGKYLFIHPSLSATRTDAKLFDAYDMYRSIGREFSLATCLVRLVSGGVLDRHPRLQVVISHLGGGISSILPRVRNYQDKTMWGVKDDPLHGRTSERPFDYYVRNRLYFDTGGFFGDPTAVQSALLQIPSERIVPGTDFPQEIREAGPAKKLVSWLSRRRMAHNGKSLLG